jgi:hypothetical protein
MLLYAVFITVSVNYGFGTRQALIQPQSNVQKAVIWETIGQHFIVLSCISAKISIGLFLMRLGAEKLWQRLSIWILIVSMTAVGFTSIILTWFQCQPRELMWDNTFVGSCQLDVSVSVIVLGCKSAPRNLWEEDALALRRLPRMTRITLLTLLLSPGLIILIDFYFAFLPWNLIWKLNMPRKEKMVVSCSLSLGVL